MAVSRRNTLTRQLLAYSPNDDREAGFQRRMLALAAGSGDPFARDNFVPGHFTASCFVLSPERDELLLVLHGKLHRWLQPGGHVDPQDADLLGAALREVREEVGLVDPGPHPTVDGLFDIDIHQIPARPGEPQHDHYDVRFARVAHSRRVAAGSDARDARWFPLDCIGELESDASVSRAAQKLCALS